jgi:cysteine desulfurase
MAKEIYLDNAATTKTDPRVLEAMLPFFNKFYGNASSLHDLGMKSREAIERARKIIAKSIGAKPEEIIFTSGGTESNNFAIKGAAFANKDKGNHIITTKIEHKCILESCKWLESQGFEVTYLDVDNYGFVDPRELEKAITKRTILVSIIHGQNEIGTIQDLKTLGEICKRHGVLLHTDACQSHTKTLLNVKKQPVDLITLNAHKIHGPKGVGALYIRKGTKIQIWQHGGGQEMKWRSGTENVPSIVGFAEAVKLAMNKKHVLHMQRLKNKFIQGLLKIPKVKINGPTDSRGLASIINASFFGIEGEALGGFLNVKKIYTSTGSACSSKTLEPSYVLLAIGLNPQEANSSIRFSLSRFTTEQDLEYALKEIESAVKKLRRISPFFK